MSWVGGDYIHGSYWGAQKLFHNKMLTEPKEVEEKTQSNRGICNSMEGSNNGNYFMQ